MEVIASSSNRCKCCWSLFYLSFIGQLTLVFVPLCPSLDCNSVFASLVKLSQYFVFNFSQKTADLSRPMSLKAFQTSCAGDTAQKTKNLHTLRRRDAFADIKATILSALPLSSLLFVPLPLLCPAAFPLCLSLPSWLLLPLDDCH